MKILQISSLDNVLSRVELDYNEINKLSVLKKERIAYQLAYKSDGNEEEYSMNVNSDISEYIKIFDVQNIPVTFASEMDTWAVDDKKYLSHEPGLFPDALIPKTDMKVKGTYYYKAIWVTVSENIPSGNHKIEIEFENKNDKITKACKIEVLDIELPKQELIYTNWFHADCISEYYRVESLSEKHWELLEKFISKAVYLGINMILTPIFTPPLDTDVGGERPTIQLVGVEKNGCKYTFDFTALKRWVDLCKKCGIKYFEISHLFTQWGAEFTPKIIVKENGEDKKLFGWHVKAVDAEYKSFLSQFIPELTAFLKNENIAENTYFHISDEPMENHTESYNAAKEMVIDYLKDFKVVDALSNYDFYKTGIVKNPIPSTDHIKPFIENNVPDLWTYYCCCQVKDLSNRLMAMPSWRNRMIGLQMFKFNIKGFLHWGYNFYYTRLSKRLLNPFFETDAGGGFPSGDAFCVYPGEDGPIDSIRGLVFHEALQDLRALKLLEEKIGHEETVKLIEAEAGFEIAFDNCVDSGEMLINIRNKINIALQKEMVK